MKNNYDKVLARIKNGQTAKSACSDEDIHYSSFWAWRKKNKDKPQVIVHDIAAAPKKKYTKTVANDRCFVIVTSPSQLGSVLRGLQ